MAEKDYYGLYVQERRTLSPFSLGGVDIGVPYRDELIAKIDEQLTLGRSVMLVGPPGVGKTAVLQGVHAARVARGEGGVVRVSSMDLLSGTHYLGDWQSKLRAWVRQSRERNEVLFFTDAWNLNTAGASDTSTDNVLDALRPLMEAGELNVVVELSVDRVRTMDRIPGFTRLFQRFDVAPLDPAQVDAVLQRVAEAAGRQVDEPVRRAMVQLTSRFLRAQLQPGPALGLLQWILEQPSLKDEELTPALVETAFAQRTGLPSFIVSRAVTKTASEVRAWFQERLVGQRAAIDAMVEAIALYKSGLHDTGRPIGTFLFVGPTGVGKTELARLLAEFVFGSPDRLLRFDLSEFKDYHAFELLLGSPRRKDSPARLLDPVRAQPFQVVLFDELEKAHPNLWDLILPLLDEGRMSAPDGDAVDFRNTIVIATSNVGAQESNRSVGFGERAGDEREGRIRQALETSFRPEFLNRFQHIVVFHSLSLIELRTVARFELARVLQREGIVAPGLTVDVDDAALDLVIRQGVDARYGARALKREIQKRLVLPLAMTLMEQAVAPGAILRINVRDGAIRVRVLETETSRAHRASFVPTPRAEPRALDREALREQLKQAELSFDGLMELVQLPAALDRRGELLSARDVPGFWRDVARASANDRELEVASDLIDRVEALEERIAGARDALEKGASRRALESAAQEVRALEEALRSARRELVVLGAAGRVDALVECRVVGASGPEMRDRLAAMYVEWAKHRGYAVTWWRDPRDDEESWLLGVRGPYAFGLLRGEAGLHRLRLAGTAENPGRRVVAAVRVAPWEPGRAVTATKDGERSVRGSGRFGSKVRAVLEYRDPDGGRLTLQNEQSATENAAAAGELLAALADAVEAPEEVVRRYDAAPPLVRDALTGWVSGRPDALAPRGLDALLVRRVDALALEDGQSPELVEGRESIVGAPRA
ncbi:MAG: AAA family ATPase [Deltaproteobacteria bacterium]|nr:AAA family ATPase [Myxococcales bacterium]MDP3216102.1 AAA family ATPase [Deltaproteobacteria bacterium]